MAFDLAAALSLKPVSKLDTKEIPVQMIDLDLIDPHPDNFFEVEEDVTDLAESIALNGLLQPLVVTPADGGRYRTIAGHRRRKALRQLAAEASEKWKRVPCMVTHPASKELEELALIQTNTEAREIGWAEKNKAANRVEAILVKLQQEQGVKLPGKMRANVAKIIKTSESQLARAKFIADNLIKPFKKKDISDSVAYKLAHLPKEQQKELYEHYENALWKLSSSTIKQYQDNIADGKDPFADRISEHARVRDCYVQPRWKNSYRKCDHGSVIEARKSRSDLPGWQKCGGKTCCSYCSYRCDCEDVCPHCAAEIKKQRGTESYALGQRLRACRLRADIPVDSAATGMELSTDMILDHETKGSFGVCQVSKYCALYGCTPNDVFGFDVPPQSDAPAKWQRLHFDATPNDGQLCQVLLYSDNPITIYGNVFCSVRAARWKDGHFMSAVNDQVPLKANLIGWLPLPEPPEGYTATLGKIDNLKSGDEHEDS